MLHASRHISPENALAIVFRCGCFYSVRLLLHLHPKFDVINFIPRPRKQKNLSLCSPQCSALRRVVNIWFFICLHRILPPISPCPLNEALNKYHIRYTIMHISLFYCVQVFLFIHFFVFTFSNGPETQTCSPLFFFCCAFGVVVVDMHDVVHKCFSLCKFCIFNSCMSFEMKQWHTAQRHY